MLSYPSGCCLILALPLLIMSCIAKPKNASTVLTTTPVVNLAGTWAKRVINTNDSSALGIKSRSKITRYNLIQTQVDGDKVLVQEKTCDFTVENSGSSSLEFPPAFTASIADTSYTYQFASTPGLGTLAIKDKVEVFGARLSDPRSEALPSSRDDARVFDQDADGEPGFTVGVKAKVLVTVSGKIYLVQRQISNETLSISDADTIKGSVSASQEQKTLGSSNPLFATVSPSVIPVPDQSTVVLRRLAAGSTCETIKAQLKPLFSNL